MAAKKSPPAPTPAPTRATETSQTIKKETTITATRTDTDATHKGDPPKGTDAGVDDVLAGVHASRDDVLNRARRPQCQCSGRRRRQPEGREGLGRAVHRRRADHDDAPSGRWRRRHGQRRRSPEQGQGGQRRRLRDHPHRQPDRLRWALRTDARRPSASDRRARLDRQVRVGRSGRSGHDHDAIGWDEEGRSGWHDDHHGRGRRHLHS